MGTVRGSGYYICGVPRKPVFSHLKPSAAAVLSRHLKPGCFPLMSVCNYVRQSLYREPNNHESQKWSQFSVTISVWNDVSAKLSVLLGVIRILMCWPSWSWSVGLKSTMIRGGKKTSWWSQKLHYWSGVVRSYLVEDKMTSKKHKGKLFDILGNTGVL